MPRNCRRFSSSRGLPSATPLPRGKRSTKGLCKTQTLSCTWPSLAESMQCDRAWPARSQRSSSPLWLNCVHRHMHRTAGNGPVSDFWRAGIGRCIPVQKERSEAKYDGRFDTGRGYNPRLYAKVVCKILHTTLQNLSRKSPRKSD
jgi:hypothetical protein